MTDTALVAQPTAPMTTSNVDPEIAGAMVVFHRLDPLREALGLEKLTEGELQLFAMVALHTGLDPFTKQIYAIKRGGKVTHQTGIDGYRSAAEKTKEYAGSDEATFEACDCGAKDSPGDHPKIARVVIHRILPNGHVVNQTGIARWHELKPEHKVPQGAYDFLDAMWWRMPYNQLAKCAEANGLRIAFPRVLGGVYITEEMQQAQVVEGTAVPVSTGPSAAARMADRRAAIEATTANPAPAADSERVTAPPSAAGTHDPSEAVQGEVVGDPSGGLTWVQFRARMGAANLTTSKVKAAAAALWPDRQLSPLPSEWELDPSDWAALAASMQI